MRDLLNSLKAKASTSSLLRTNHSSFSLGEISDDAQEGPSLPPPGITHPFPVVEQPPRCMLTSVLDPNRRLTCMRKGVVGVSNSRGEREQFLLIPVEEREVDADDDTVSYHSALDGASADDGSSQPATRRRARRKDMFYLKSYKFNRYLTADETGAVSTIDLSKKEDDNGSDNAGGESESNSNGRTAMKPGGSERWLLMRSPHGGHFLVSSSHERNLACRHTEGSATTICLASNNDQSESWDVSFVSGELCFLSSGPGDDGTRIRCDLIGKLTLTDDRRGWEVWRFVEMGGGKVRIVSWMHSQFCIACNHDGKVSTVGIGKAEEGCDLWTAEKAPEKAPEGGYAGVVIKSVACARRILSRGEEGLCATQELEGESGIWQLDAAHSQTFTLASFGQKRSIGPFPYVTENARQSDQLVLQQVDSAQGTVRLYHAKKGQYLRSDVEGLVSCSPEPPNDDDISDLWRMQSQEGGYTFASKRHGGLLAFNTDEPNPRLCTVPSPADDNRHLWSVDPVLPRAISSSKIKTFALGTSIAVGTTVAMPFLVAGALAVVPAEATLAASVIGAGLTGAEAVASVGAIGATAAIVFRESSDALGMESEHEDGGGEARYTKRPLCAWRSW